MQRIRGKRKRRRKRRRKRPHCGSSKYMYNNSYVD